MSDQLPISQILHRESRSFLQYVRESYPWASGKCETARTVVQRVAAEEEVAVAKLARLALKRHLTLPAMGNFPAAFTNFNYVDVSYLIPKLATAQRQELADLERDLPSVGDPDLKTALESLRDLKKKDLAELEGLIAVKAA